eukprot:15331896-Alexandrium_andersonii.AAC.1
MATQVAIPHDAILVEVVSGEVDPPSGPSSSNWGLSPLTGAHVLETLLALLEPACPFGAAPHAPAPPQL